MAKKTMKGQKKKSIRRTSTMAKAIAQGQQFLADTNKRKSKRTKTMTETIKEGQQIMQRRTRKAANADQSRSQSVQPKADKKKQKKITKSRVSKIACKTLASGSKKTESRPTKPSKKAKKNKRLAIPSRPSLPQIMKKTIFKTKSKDHLPLPAFGFIDVCFCIDATGSMGSQLAQAQSTIKSIINNVQKKVQTQGLTLRFAVVSYRDHPPQDSTYVTQALDFTDGHEASEYVQKLQAIGGGDFPEAVHDGLMHSCRSLNWIELPGTPVLRYIFHIADAPPHGRQFGNLSQANQGCLCGMKISQVYHEINVKQIHFRLLKARSGTQLTQMEEHFRKNIVDFDSINLQNAKQMDVRVSDMIIHEVVPGAY